MATVYRGAAAGLLTSATCWSLGKDVAHDIMAPEVPPQAAKASSDHLDFISALSPHSCTTSYVLRALFSSVQFSRSVVSDSLQPHGLQYARPPCPSPTPGVYSNWCPLSWWCHPTTSSSVVPFSSHLQSFPASGPFQMSQFFTLGGQRAL